ncbi:hypothetical protein TraAM80_05350 [Trypanosoma rangeli]|uniref:RING-type domain-containing protein n=1 Tax=Trypanosoma rangeli TaxID=5698 RepID=A0A422NF71_TRYRA|nr:uncharacterized protein TraAM80_05350 [Trypanosoma rangeli]RNF04115.1 hypothetical protein TraAM80_05350 [Trypanosoma rangeli]|eukprot:RNF04115.1 hypothetical protein TraAM80_05350 [Trypanosoma rangeli]
MAAVWRSFKFFESEVLKGPLSRMEITSCCYGHKALFVGDGEGFVYAVDRGGATTLLEFPAYKGAVTHMKHLRSRNVLVTIGDDDALNTGILRVWSLDAVSESTPPCREHRLFGAKYPPPSESVVLRTNYNAELMSSLKFRGREGDAENAIPVTAFRTVVVDFDVSEDLQNAAVALVSDEVVVLRGDLERDPSVKMRRLRSGVARGAIAFVGFPGAKFTPRGAQGKQHLFGPGAGNAVAHALYIVFADVVTVWQVTGAADYAEHRCDPPFGAAPECCSLTDGGQLVVASTTSDQIAIFGSEEVLSPSAQTSITLPVFDPTLFGAVHFAEVEGRKRRLLAHRGYVVVLTQSGARPEKFTLQCYDLFNRLRCLARTQENACTNAAWLVADAVDILVICQEARHEEFVAQRVVRLVETDLQARLEQLFQKECYDVAKRLVRRLHAADASQQMSIQKKYGDYLVSKEKYAEAIDQYIEAIGFLEPSYVIRIFVNGQHTTDLTRYLEELHHKRHGNLANRSHTTLLLNCYIKLRDEARLSAFIHRDDIRFDAHNAIEVCRQAGYYDAAIYLAEKYAQPHDYVMIQLENLHNPTKALAFIRTLGVDDAEAILLEVGKDLAGMEPRASTEVVAELCIQWKGPARRLADPTRPHRGAAQNYSYPLQRQSRPPHRGEAKEFMQVFVDSPVCLFYFLRAVVESGVIDGGDESQRLVYNTLLELYMTRELRQCIRHQVTPEGTEVYTVEPYERRLEQALTFMEAYAGSYDDYHALALAEQHDFEEGVLLLLRRLHLPSDIMQYYAKRLEEGATPAIRRAAREKLIDACCTQLQQGGGNLQSSSGGVSDRSKANVDNSGNRGFDESTKELWLSLLSLLVRSPDTEWKDLVQVLECIEAHNLLSPLAVVEVLSTNPKLQLGTVREYVLRMMRRDAQRAEELHSLIDARLKKLHELHSEIDALQTKATVFQAHKCYHCHTALDLPVVHFMCQHSFHQRCLNDITECNVCAPAHRRLAAEQREVEERHSDPNVFFERLGAANDADGFSIVAEQFGKCIFAAPQLRKEATLFSGDPMVRGAAGAHDSWNGLAISSDDDDMRLAAEEEDGEAVYDEDGELLRPEAVELW